MKDYIYLGDYSATPPWHSRLMWCDDCMVTWHGCWDNFQCPKCGKGALPNSDMKLSDIKLMAGKINGH